MEVGSKLTYDVQSKNRPQLQLEILKSSFFSFVKSKFDEKNLSKNEKSH